MPKLMYCHACKIDTVQYPTKSGKYVCWCGGVNFGEVHQNDLGTHVVISGGEPLEIQPYQPHDAEDMEDMPF